MQNLFLVTVLNEFINISNIFFMIRVNAGLSEVCCVRFKHLVDELAHF